MRRTFFLTGSLDLFLITKLIVREFVGECPRSEWASEVQELLANAKEVVITTDMTGKNRRSWPKYHFCGVLAT